MLDMSKQSTLPMVEVGADRELLTERLEVRLPPSLRAEILSLVKPGVSINKTMIRAMRVGIDVLKQQEAGAAAA